MNRPLPARARSASFLALSCVGFLASAPAFAADVPHDSARDEAANDDQLIGNEVQVVGDRERRGAKEVAPALNTPKSVVILPAQVIEQTGSASLADALRTVPGITFGAAEGGNPIGDRPFIRGFDSQGSTYVDGVRDFSAQTREVFATDSVQVVRGSDSTLGGRGSAGGSINVISKLPVTENFINTSFSAGTADYKRATADVNYLLAPTVGVRVTAMAHDQDFAGRDAIWARRWGVAPSVTIGLGTPTRLTAAYYHVTSHELPDSGIPFLYTIANAPLGTSYDEPAIGTVTLASGVTGNVPRSAFYGLASRDFRDSTTDQATLRVEHDFGGITLRNTARYNYNYQSYIFLLPDDSNGNVFGTSATPPTAGSAAALRGDAITGGYVWRRGNTRYGYAKGLTNQTDLFGTLDTGAVHHSFALGFEYSTEKARRGQWVTRGFLGSNGLETLSTGSTISPRCNTATIARYYCASLFNPNPYDPWVNYASDTSTTRAPIVKYLPQEETQNEAKTTSFYGFDSITIVPQLILNLGARYDAFTTKVILGQTIAQINAGAPIIVAQRTDKLFNWQAGLVFKPSPATSIYASYATSATPPNSLLGEGQDPNNAGTVSAATVPALLDSLKVEKTRSYEIGAKANLFDNRLALTFAAFQTDTDNARVTGPNNTVEFIGKRRIRGLEFTFNGAILPGWLVFGGYTHLDPKILDGGFTALTVAANGAAPATTVQVPSVNTGRQATQTARDSATISTDWQVTPAFSFGGGAYYTSRVFGGYQDNRSATQTIAGVITVNPATRTVLRTIPGYVRFDAHAAYKFDEHVSLSVNVQNLTNKTYFTQAYTSHYATIAPGRSAFATLNLKY